jgi:transposase
MNPRRPYRSDISDARWALIEPTLTAWRQARLDRRPTGAPAPTDLREIFNAILKPNRTGVAWAYLPHDFPPHGTVYSYYAAWRDEGIFAQLNYDLTGLARAKEGRDPEPTAAVIDTQTIKTSTNPPTASQGTDAAKKIVGRTRAYPPMPSACSSPWSSAPPPSRRTRPASRSSTRPRAPTTPWL